MKYLAATALLLALLSSGCTSVVPAGPAPALQDTAWVVTQIAGEPTLADYRPTMNFRGGGELNGDNGCNLYAGTYTLADTGLALTPPAQTMMACTDPARAAQESAFAAALATVAAVRGSGDGVELLDSAGGVALRLAPVPAPELAGTSWLLTGLVDGPSVSMPAEGTTVTLGFEGDTLSGKACNSFRGGYSLAGNDITVGAVASTRMMCSDPGVMEQEALVLELLEAASTVQLNRGVLVLAGADGRGLQFSRA